MRFKNTKIKNKNSDDRVFDIINFFFLALITIICFYPLYYIVMVSFSDTPVGVKVAPNGFQLEGYKLVLGDSKLWKAYFNTIIYTVGGILFSLTLTVPCAYALSRKDLPGRKVFSIYLLITMFISGGMIPTYLVVQKLHLLNSWLVVIIMTGVSVYNIIVARTFFSYTIPGELLDAALIDGCSNGAFLVKIVLPLSKPILAVLSLWIGVSRWNSYFTELLYLTDEDKQPIGLYLRKLIWQVDALMKLITEGQRNGEMVEVSQSMMEQARLASIMQYVVIIVATVPMLLVYPFLQKYFAKGVMIGSIKG